MGRAIAAILASLPPNVDWHQQFEEWLHPDNDLLASRETQPELDDLVYFVTSEEQVCVRRMGKTSISDSTIDWQSSFMLNMIARLACWLRASYLDQNLIVKQVRGERVFASPHRGVEQVWPRIHFTGNMMPIELPIEGILVVELVVCWSEIPKEQQVGQVYRPLDQDCLLLFQGAVGHQKLQAATVSEEILLKSPQGNGAQAILHKSKDASRWSRLLGVIARRNPLYILEGIFIQASWISTQLMINARLIRKEAD